MKRVILFLSVCCFSCSSPGPKSASTADSSSRPVSAEAIPAFKTLDTIVPFPGVWVNADYIKKIRNHESVHLAQNVDESCIIIPRRTLQTTRMVSGFHEGAADMVIVRDGAQYKFYSADLTLFMKNIASVSDSLIRIGDQAFVRLRHPDTTRTDWGILEECLFEGRYTDQEGRTVIFTANGRVSGLDSFSHYVPEIDYSETADLVDRVQLGRSPEHLEYFGFRFERDSLFLYSIACSIYDTAASYCDSGTLGKRLYTLRRIKDDQ